ncbi:MAG: redoxin domain-containing protein [Bacteroidales bacterium]|nr:redoxin domain-containing protein [Bacteroidales bacterium]
MKIKNFGKRTIFTNIGIIAILFMGSCNSPVNEKIPVLTFGQLEPLLRMNNDTVYVINFWATWCKPCIKEMPDFEKLNANYKNKPVKVILVSLDFPDKHESDLIPFIQKENIRSEVIHLNDPDANEWIDKVSPFWSGSIPATLVYKGNSSEFHEKSLTYEELKTIVESKI